VAEPADVDARDAEHLAGLVQLLLKCSGSPILPCSRGAGRGKGPSRDLEASRLLALAAHRDTAAVSGIDLAPDLAPDRVPRDDDALFSSAGSEKRTISSKCHGVAKCIPRTLAFQA